MAETGAESTPLLLDVLSPTASSSNTGASGGASALARNYGQPPAARLGVGGYRRGSQFQRRSQVHPLHQKQKSFPTQSRHFSSTQRSSRRLSSTTSSSRRLSSTPSHQTISVPTTNKIWRALVSLPHHLLCFSSPICSPCCGICCCFTCIRTSEYGVMQRFGKFERILQPGLHFLKWPMEREAGRISMRIKQLDIDIETKSKDHVFLRVHVSIQYQTNSTHLYESFYSLQSPIRQMTSHTHDILRSTLPQLYLDEIFASSKDSIASELQRSLDLTMNQYGYMVHQALICRIDPNAHVKESMNEMEASKRMKEAMPQKAEAVWIEKVKDAEAKSERAYLNGVGVARERGAIANGMRQVVDGLLDDAGKSSGATRVTTKGVMDMLLLTQYLDVITDLNGKCGAAGGDEGDQHPDSSLFMMHMPETVSQLTATARECFGSSTSDAVTVENLLEL